MTTQKLPLLALMVTLGCGSSTNPDDSGAAGAAGADGGADAVVCDEDSDGHDGAQCGGADCDDTREDIHPGAADTCDGDDNDCDGEVDPGDGAS